MERRVTLNVLQKLDHCFINHKQFLSMVFQGAADSESRFVFIDKGAYGKQSDGDTFSAFTFCHFLEDFQSPLPNM